MYIIKNKYFSYEQNYLGYISCDNLQFLYFINIRFWL